MRFNVFYLSILTILLNGIGIALEAVQAELATQYAKPSGTVTDDAGVPIEGIRVDISTAAPKVGQGIFCPSCYLDCRKWATTNEHGEFEIVDLDPSLKFRLVAAGPAHKASQTDLINPNLGPVKIALAKLPMDVDPNVVLTGTEKTDLVFQSKGR